MNKLDHPKARQNNKCVSRDPNRKKEKKRGRIKKSRQKITKTMAEENRKAEYY